VNASFENPGTTEQTDRSDELRRRSRRSFLTFGVGAIGAAGGWRWLTTRSTDDGIAWPLRRVLGAEGHLARLTTRSSARVAELAASEARPLRANGNVGLVDTDDPASWSIEIEHGATVVGQLTLARLMSLPQHRQTVLHKCIEGWSTAVTWRGPRLRDAVLLAAEEAGIGSTTWIGLSTADRAYYVSLPHRAAMHPQALLALQLGDEPLTADHGAPVRLALPTHYGVKSIKQVGRITFTDDEPPDYWAERGYDKDMSF
jgi:DMSO/TMAO reductase YedYZ molybdopterin-dependent catalytic subunit